MALRTEQNICHNLKYKLFEKSIVIKAVMIKLVKRLY